MLKRSSLLLLCNFLLIAGLSAQDAQKDKKVLKNSDILLMVENHFDDDTLVKVIEVSDTDFDLSGDALVALKSRGVSSAVLLAMLRATQHKRLAAAAPVAGSLPGQPSGSVDSPAPPGDASATPAPPANPADAAPDRPASSATKADNPALVTRERQKPMDPRTAMRSMGMGKGMDGKQFAALGAQMSAMGLGGMFGGSFSLSNYTPEQMPHVFLVAPTKQEISPSTAEIAQSKFKSGNPGAGGTILRNLATEGLSFAAMAGGPAGMMGMSVFSMASGFMPGMRPGSPSFTYVWGLPGRKSSRELTDLNPRFELSYGEIPGVDPDGYEPALVKLIPTKDNYRLVGATRTKMDKKNMMSSMVPENGKWVSEERWPTHLDKEERGFFVLRVDQPLEPGEYAVVLRPVKDYKAVPSGFGGAAQVFYSVWDFSVPGAPAVETSGKKKKH